MIHPEGNLIYLINQQLQRTYHSLADNWLGMAVVAIVIVVLAIGLIGAMNRIARDERKYRL